MSHLLEPQLKRSKYRLLGLIGHGQSGRVYCAVHRRTGQLVALKALDHDRFSTHKFLRELRFLLTLQHPNIVACTTLEHHQGLRYLVMDYCDSGTLRSLMEDHRLHPALSVKLILDVLAGIDHAHRHNIVHCDIKPENILLNLQPDGWTARISDFGIAQMTQERMSEGAGITGSPAYMAPERFYGQNSPSCDVYAIGVLLFELLTGDRPFSGTPSALMSAHLNQPVKIPDDVPFPLQAIVLTALQKLKARRFSSASEMAIALKSAVENCPELQAETLLTPPVKFSAPPQIGTHSCRKYSQGILSKSKQLGEAVHVMKLVEPIQELVVRPQGCFAVTPRSLYLLKDYPQPLVQFGQPSLVTIEPQGRWAATIELQKPISLLNICRFSDSTILSSSLSTAHLFKLLALDSRHLVVLSHRLTEGTLLEFFTRRRQAIGRLELAVNLDRVLLGFSPYSLIATEPEHPKSILIINLKPLKLNRVAIEITPTFLAATSWGYILMDLQGQMILLDRDGQTLDRGAAPINPCAIAPFGKFGLLLSTWNGTQGHLYTIDLEQQVGRDSEHS